MLGLIWRVFKEFPEEEEEDADGGFSEMRVWNGL
jgi:hypothetical protein